MSSEEDNFEDEVNINNEDETNEEDNEEKNEEEIEEDNDTNKKRSKKEKDGKKEKKQKKNKKTEIIEEGEGAKTFEEFGLDPRLLKAITKANFTSPTIVQSAAIPLALKGKDILAKAKTGSGKTAAYVIPILQQLIKELEKINDNQRKKGVRVLILVPSAELCSQVQQQIKQLILYTPFISVLHLARSIPLEVQKTRLAEMPDIVISTPSQLIPHLRDKDINLNEHPGLGWIVLDEADLLMSYGYEEDIKEIANHIPKAGCQSFLMSATLNSSNDEELVDTLKELILNNPAILKLEEEEKAHDLLQQFSISCTEADKFLVLFVLIKLRLIRGKIIFFVNEIDRCYRLKLFFERFSIKSAVMNSELPQNSRNHIIAEFNKGVFDYLIATDENLFNTNQKQGKRKKDKEYMVARGVDFKFVKAVVNFDLPPSKEAYVHRIGRTARGGTRGLALSFVTPKTEPLFAEIKKHIEEDGLELKPFSFNMSAIEGFRYRVEDVSRSVTRAAIREARVKELKAEVMNSAKLKAHFEDNPQDLSVLQHDQILQQTKVQPHLRVVPDYLLRDVKKKGIVAKQPTKVSTKRKWEPKKSGAKSDPLKTFSYKKRKTE